MDSDQRPRVLVIDDEETICIAISDLLSVYGFVTDYALSAEEGLGRLGSNVDTDIVLLDLNLGSGMSGVEAIPEIRARSPYVQVVVLTSEDSLDAGLACMKCGAFDFLTKPFDEKLFLKLVPGALERKNILRLADIYLEILVHDLRNPLQNILLPIESLISSGSGLTDEQRESLDVARFGCWQIDTMIRDILCVTKKEEKSLASTASDFLPAEELGKRLAVLFNNIGLRKRKYSVSFPGCGNRTVRTDPDLFFRVIGNIAHNALRFTPAGGTISIEIGKEAGNLLVSVTNPGSFIAEEHREKIFDKYSTVSGDNNYRFYNFGLGLTFCRAAVEALGGKIWVTGKKEPEETTFCFTVPDGSPDRTDLRS